MSTWRGLGEAEKEKEEQKNAFTVAQSSRDSAPVCNYDGNVVPSFARVPVTELIHFANGRARETGVETSQK